MHAKQHTYTAKDIATTSRQRIEKVRRDIRDGKFDPEDFWSVCRYITSKRLAEVD